MREFSPQELKEYLETADEKPLLIDVREPWEYERCHIEGSRLIPRDELAEVSQELDPEREIVVICHYGVRSYDAAMYLEQTGFENVGNLDGGIDAWAQEVDREMPRY